MRSLLPLIVPVMAVFLGCGTPATDNADRTARMPDSASAAVGEDKPAKIDVPARYALVWERPALDEWDAYWMEQYAPDSSGDLRQRTADLDGDGGVDQALFLVRMDTTHRDSSYALVVSFSNGRDTLLASYPWAESEGGIGMGLTLEPPGELGHLGGEEGEEEIPSPVRITQPAITLMFFEKASITWYWSSGIFHQVWTGD